TFIEFISNSYIVRSGLGCHCQRDHRNTAFLQHGFFILGSEYRLAYLAKMNVYSINILYDQSVEILFRLQSPEGAHRKFRVVTRYLTRGKLNILTIERLLYVLKRDAVS